MSNANWQVLFGNMLDTLGFYTIPLESSLTWIALPDQLASEAPEDRPGLRLNLAKILRMQLDVSPLQHPNPQFQTLYHKILEELESLRYASESERVA
jgi:hypothetical protein